MELGEADHTRYNIHVRYAKTEENKAGEGEGESAKTQVGWIGPRRDKDAPKRGKPEVGTEDQTDRKGPADHGQEDEDSPKDRYGWWLSPSHTSYANRGDEKPTLDVGVPLEFYLKMCYGEPCEERIDAINLYFKHYPDLATLISKDVFYLPND